MARGTQPGHRGRDSLDLPCGFCRVFVGIFQRRRSPRQIRIPGHPLRRILLPIRLPCRPSVLALPTRRRTAAPPHPRFPHRLARQPPSGSFRRHRSRLPSHLLSQAAPADALSPVTTEAPYCKGRPESTATSPFRTVSARRETPAGAGSSQVLATDLNDKNPTYTHFRLPGGRRARERYDGRP